MTMFDPKLPLIDLHRHLDGSIRLETILDLGRQHDLPLPAWRGGTGSARRRLTIRCSRPPSAQILNLALPATSALIVAPLPGRQGADHPDHRRAISPFR